VLENAKRGAGQRSLQHRAAATPDGWVRLRDVLDARDVLTGIGPAPAFAARMPSAAAARAL
jgi:hypothetical protein